MKLYNWLDSLFDDRKKRRAWLGIFSCLFLFVEFFFLMGVFFSLIKIRNYDGLFAYSTILESYQASFWVSVISQIISEPQITAEVLMKSIFQSFHLYEVFGILVIVLYCMGTKKRGNILFLGILICVLFLLVCFCIIFGMQAGSLNEVILALRIMGYGGLLICIVIQGDLLCSFARLAVRLQQIL